MQPDLCFSDDIFFDRVGSLLLCADFLYLQHVGLVAPQYMESSWTRNQIHVSCMAGRFLTTGPPGKSLMILKLITQFICLSANPGGGHGNPFQYSCLENHMDRSDPSPWACKESDTTEQLSTVKIKEYLRKSILVIHHIKKIKEKNYVIAIHSDKAFHKIQLL